MPRYFIIDPGLKQLWKEEYEKWTPSQKKFMERAVEIAKKEFDKPSQSVVQ